MLGGLVFLLLPLLALAIRSQSPARGWRESWVWAALVWGAGILVSTEILGACSAFRFGPVLASWLAANVFAGTVAWRAVRRHGWPPLPRLDAPLVRVVAAMLCLLLTIALITALAAPPNTPDVLSYHLPRQMMWLQQGSLAHFATVNDRALMMPPLAEIIQAHAMLLAHGDGWANFPQWFAYALGMMVVSLLARELGGRPAAQWLAALLFALLPMAWHEASSAKNDLLVAVWLGIVAWQCLRLAREEPSPTRDWLVAGTALGLALATKTTALVFAAPMLLVIAVSAVRQARRAWVLVAIIPLLIGPHLTRNLAWYGTPLGVHRAEDGGAQANEVFGWRATASNAVRHATLHLATPSPAINHAMESAVTRLHRAIGQDGNDPRTTLWTLRYAVVWLPQSEPFAGAPAQCFFAGLVTLWFLWRRPGMSAPLQVFAMAAGGALLVCVLLKWQPWAARLHLPVFIFVVALTAWLAEKFGTVALVVVTGIAVLGWLPSAQTDIRPLWSTPTLFAADRWQNYFRTDPADQARTEATLQALAAARVTSLQIITRHGFPYPLMRRYADRGGPAAAFWGTLPDSGSKPPDGVLLMEPFERALPLYVSVPLATERYRAAGATDPFGLYLPESQARAQAAELPLPRFVGWDKSSGLGPFEPVSDRSLQIFVRRPTEPTVRLHVRPAASQMSLHLEVFNVSAAASELEVRINGERVAPLRLEALTGKQAFDVALTLPSGACELTIASAGTKPPAIAFASLQVHD